MDDTSDAHDVLLNQLADEFAARQRAGERPRLEEYCDRHPALAEDIRALFPALVELERAKADIGPELAVTAAPPMTNLGDFRLLREVGRGGMGVVYEADQVSLGRRVAIKLLPFGVLRDPTKRRRFEREAKAAAKLHHTNIVPVHGFGEHEGTPYYVMQYIPGLGLDAVIDELARSPAGGRTPDPTQSGDRAATSEALARSLVGRPDAAPDTLPDSQAGPAPVSLGSSGVHLPGRSGSSVSGSSVSGTTYWESVARIGVQVAGALAYAHRVGVLHRDIKPSNLLLDMDGIVWVTDFGLAKADDSDDLTHTGDLLGTLRYMPPEAFDGKFDARGDVYAIGLTLFELIALRPAFEEGDRNKLVKQVTTGDPPRLGKLRQDAPRNLVTIVEKATEKDPARRYPTAAALADDLQRYLDGRPIAARRATEVERVWMWVRRRPAMAGLVAALVLCLAGGSVVSTVFAVRAEGFARDAEFRERQAKDNQDRAEANERDAIEQGKRADQNLYHAEMPLAVQAWREHRGLPNMRALLNHWLPRGDGPDRRGWEWFYVNSLPYQSLRTLTEGTAGVGRRPCTVAWNAATRRLAEGTAEGRIRIWDADREQTTLTLTAPPPTVLYHGTRWLDWSRDGGKLAAGGHGGAVTVWEIPSGRKLREFPGNNSAIISVAFNADGTRLATWAQSGFVQIWDVLENRLSDQVLHAGSTATAGAWSPDGLSVATGRYDGTVSVSAPRAGAKIDTFQAQVDSIYHVAWSPDGTRLATTSANDFFVNVWDVAEQKTVLPPLRHSHGITVIAWEPTGHRLATGSMDETIKVWDAATGHEETTLRGQRANVVSLAWGPDGRLASGGSDGSLRVWDSVHDQESGTLPGHAGQATAVAWSAGGERLASAGNDGVVRIWDPTARREVQPLRGHDRAQIEPQFGLIRSLAWNPDGTLLASAGLDGVAKVWEVASGREVFATSADRGAVWSVAWNAGGTRLAVGSQDGSIRIVEGLPLAPTVRRDFPAHPGVAKGECRNGVRSLAWSPQGDRLASAGWDRLVKLWNPDGVAVAPAMKGHTSWVFGLAWNPTGTQLASAGTDRIVIIWDAKTGGRFQTLRGHNDFVDAVAWSPDGSRVATASIDNSVRVWVPETGAEAFALRGNSVMFHDVSWRPDGTQLAAAGSDGRVWVWDATRGFERDTTPRALPNIERALAAGTARGDDRRRFAEAYIRAGKPDAAVAVLKDDPAGLARLARELVRQGNGPTAATVRAVALAGLEAKWAKEPENPDWTAELAQALVESDRTREAVPLLTTLACASPTDAALTLKAAALQVWFGLDADYAATCQQVRASVGNKTDPYWTSPVVKVCCLRPLADSAEREAILAMASKGSKDARGLAEYRAGNYAVAAALLATPDAGIKGVAAFFRAMSLFRLGQLDEARRLAAETAAGMKSLPPDDRNPLGGGGVPEDLILWLAHKEAATVMGITAAAPSPMKP
ncbi:WD40 domain-containing protein [Limnoglobus roseus]|uniref:Serine/threonine protein kinase n=1 Tax=Limnoglobus roseus TaxID=2598579 RepID=A0A5C1ACE3_9BACT|nr:protein kinase [Limnoglobus roseus]QEL16410.1 serine/threonine protein kinase [Limnoglobus roseus]